LKDVEVRALDPVPVERSLRGVGTAALRILTQRLDLEEFDALLVVCEGLGDFVPLTHRKIPAFCLCLTPLRIAFDPFYRARYLQDRSPLHRMMVGMGSAAFRTVDRLAWRRYQRVFAISDEVRGRILNGRLTTPERITILNPGVELSAFVPSVPVNRTFFVPGRIMWTKNLELAIEAFRIFHDEVPDREGWRLRIAGIVDRKSAPHLERLRALADGHPAIEFRIHPSDEEMLQDYRDCFGTLFTAFNEDWGLVVIEALASGKPVVAVNQGGPAEIVRHEEDGLLAPPEPRAFADAMLRLATEPELYERIAVAGPPAAARFGWDPFIRKLDQALDFELRGAVPAEAPQRVEVLT
jgi:glycosyltransferase involved in cell wall biosynthesis